MPGSDHASWCLAMEDEEEGYEEYSDSRFPAGS